jgi:hypothetical protein
MEFEFEDPMHAWISMSIESTVCYADPTILVLAPLPSVVPWLGDGLTWQHRHRGLGVNNLASSACSSALIPEKRLFLELLYNFTSDVSVKPAIAMKR